MSMNVLLLGSGGREHALVARLSADPGVEVLCAPGNPGIARLCPTHPVDLTSPDAMAALAARERVDLTVSGPELPLSVGVADRFDADQRLLLGPTAAAAQLEQLVALGYVAPLPEDRGKAVRETVRAASDIGLEHLTLFAFSSENWKRPKTEVGALMGLFRSYFRSDMDELVERNIKVRIIGHRGRAASDILQMIRDAESRTARNTGMNLTFAFDYGGQEEIAAAAQELARAAREGRNPLTGAPVKIAATHVPKFRPGADFKATVSGGKKAPAKKAPAKKAAAKKK